MLTTLLTTYWELTWFPDFSFFFFGSMVEQRIKTLTNNHKEAKPYKRYNYNEMCILFAILS